MALYEFVQRIIVLTVIILSCFSFPMAFIAIEIRNEKLYKYMIAGWVLIFILIIVFLIMCIAPVVLGVS